MENSINSLSVDSDDELFNLLVKNKVPTQSWGKGNAKTYWHLLDEVQSKESIFTIDVQGRLIRHITILFIDVFYTDSKINKKFRLIEDRQTFRDGRTRRRNTLSGSIAEKVLFGEQADQSAVNRALKEELGILQNLEATFIKEDTTLGNSQSFPGLLTEAKNYYYSVHMPQESFMPEGYIERQKDKDTYFVWREIDSEN